MTKREIGEARARIAAEGRRVFEERRRGGAPVDEAMRSAERAMHRMEAAEAAEARELAKCPVTCRRRCCR